MTKTVKMQMLYAAYQGLRRVREELVPLEIPFTAREREIYDCLSTAILNVRDAINILEST